MMVEKLRASYILYAQDYKALYRAYLTRNTDEAVTIFAPAHSGRAGRGTTQGAGRSG